MDNNLNLSPDGQLAFALAALRGLDRAGPLEAGQHLVPGVFFSVDPETTNRVEVESRPGEILSARLVVEEPGRWLSLNFDLGRADLTGCGIIGFAIKSDSPGTTTCRVCIRTGTEDGPKDVFFPKTLVSFPKTSLHLDVLQLGHHPEIPPQAEWRELVFFFEVVSQTLNIRDFRLFII